MKLNSRLITNLLRVVCILCFLIIIGTHVLDGVMQLDDRQVRSYFQENGVEGSINYLINGNYSVRVVRASIKQTDTCIIFSHGAPGSWDAFKSYMIDNEILQRADVVSYDRPGYGASGIGKSMTSIRDQAQIVNAIRGEHPYQKYLLVSHSYGGPVMTWHALENPEGLIGNMLIAPAIDPHTEKFFWFSGFFFWKWSRWLWPASFQVAADEKYTHPNELLKLEKEIHRLSVPTMLIHSRDDWIAPAAGNIEFLRKKIPDSLLRNEIFEDKGHLLIWTDEPLIKRLILDFIG